MQILLYVKNRSFCKLRYENLKKGLNFSSYGHETSKFNAILPNRLHILNSVSIVEWSYQNYEN